MYAHACLKENVCYREKKTAREKKEGGGGRHNRTEVHAVPRPFYAMSDPKGRAVYINKPEGCLT